MTLTLNQKMDLECMPIVLISFLAILIVASTIQNTVPSSAGATRFHLCIK